MFPFDQGSRGICIALTGRHSLDVCGQEGLCQVHSSSLSDNYPHYLARLICPPTSLSHALTHSLSVVGCITEAVHNDIVRVHCSLAHPPLPSVHCILFHSAVIKTYIAERRKTPCCNNYL